MKLSHLLLFAALLFCFTGCNNNSKPKANPTIPPKFVEKEPIFKNEGELFFMEQGDTIAHINIEKADTDAEIEKGLMYRKSMKQNEGMLFLFRDEARRSFWMKNTNISLDIIFINSEYEIVNIAENTKPYSLQSIPSIEYAQYVVEVNAGFCKYYNIKTGNSIYYK